MQIMARICLCITGPDAAISGPQSPLVPVQRHHAKGVKAAAQDGGTAWDVVLRIRHVPGPGCDQGAPRPPPTSARRGMAPA